MYFNFLIMKIIDSTVIELSPVQYPKGTGKPPLQPPPVKPMAFAETPPLQGSSSQRLASSLGLTGPADTLKREKAACLCATQQRR